MDWHMSPFVVPLGGCLVGIVAIICGVADSAYKRKLKGEQLLAMLARGMSPSEIEGLLSADGKSVRDPLNAVASTRRTAIVLISTGIGIVLFFAVLAWIVDVERVLSGGAVGLIPLSIGVGYLIDYNLQKREMARFALDVGKGD
jgi:hypothetical protein